MSRQITPKTIVEPQGLSYINEFLTKSEEQELIDILYQQKWCGRGIHPNAEMKRRLQFYGYVFSYRYRIVTSTALNAPQPLKDAVSSVEQVVDDGYLMKRYPFNMVLINEYELGQGIMAHNDAPLIFGPIIAIISLLSPCIISFFRGDERRDIVLEPRSLLIMQDEASLTRSQLPAGVQSTLLTKTVGMTMPESTLKMVYPQGFTPAINALLARLKLVKVLSVDDIRNIAALEQAESVEKGYGIVMQCIREHFAALYPNMPEQVVDKGAQALTSEEIMRDVARRCGFQHVTTTQNINSIHLMPSMLVHCLSQQSESHAKYFIQQHFLNRRLNWEPVAWLDSPEATIEQISQQFYGQPHKTRLLNETGRQSPMPLFVIGVFSGARKLGEGFGQSLSMAIQRARNDAILKHYLDPQKKLQIC
ncbi:hypothetical protein MIR68_004831 [Amoeboaphelidium protococcarum]|nr:hypothetical protein MIR68_004831 [Amoeboaphelidium protococcarum]